MNDHPSLERIRTRPIFAVVRTPSADSALKAAQAAIAGGIKLIEVTLSTPGAHRVISDIRREHGQAVLVGAGSVLSTEVADRAVKAGAQFVVSPHTNISLLEYCTTRGVLSIAGAVTPTEIMTAWSLGCPIVQVYPASSFGGAAYVKSLYTSLGGVRLMPTGGVGPENMHDYVRAGAYAIGVDSGLFPAGDIKTGNYTRIAERARALAVAYDEIV